MRQISHLYGFSPVWILLCVTRLSDRVNRLLQTVHLNGSSPECLRLCIARSWLVLQHMPHSVHLYVPLWIFMWLYKLSWDENRFSHWVHKYWFSRVSNPLRLVKHVNCLSLKYVLDDLSSCVIISVWWWLLSASVFTSNELSPTVHMSTTRRHQSTTPCDIISWFNAIYHIRHIHDKHMSMSMSIRVF